MHQDSASSSSSSPPVVTIRANKVVVKGSPLVEKMNINDRIKLDVKTVIRESSLPLIPSDEILADEMADGTIDEITGEIEDGTKGSWGDGSGSGRKQEPSLEVTSFLDVWCEVVPPFHLVPISFLERSCSVIVNATLKALVKVFTSHLLDDFRLWSSSEKYRSERANKALVNQLNA